MSDKPQTEKSWQARISEATDALAQSFVQSISYDKRLYKHDIAGSIAHATMLAQVDLITRAERDAIIEGLKGIEKDIESNRFTFDETLEDIHMVVEAELIKRVGEPGRRLHTGRSRNDQVAFDLVLWLLREAAAVHDKIKLLAQSFVALAERSKDIVMPSYTHLQRAQPISAGAEALAWCTAFYDDAYERFAYFRAKTSTYYPLGSGAIAGTSLPIDRPRKLQVSDGHGWENEFDLPSPSSI